MAMAASTGPERYFPARPESVHEAREFVVSALAESEVDPDDVAVLTTEVATNAVLHANTDFRVRVEVRDEAVRIEVINDAPDLLLIRKEPSRDGGRGLRILDSLARDWGVEEHADDKVVWFEVERRRYRR
jgi:anti-sigma regulatory factor (Ser/Thr protein kinase)